MLQCAAVCCSVLQCVTYGLECSVLQCVEVCHTLLHFVAVYCVVWNVMCITIFASNLVPSLEIFRESDMGLGLQCAVECCSDTECVALCCTVYFAHLTWV